MIDSLELYREALTFAKTTSLTKVTYFSTARNYYLQLVMTIFYELATQRNSPLMSLLCTLHAVRLTPKNFSLSAPQVRFNMATGSDLLILVYGLNIALTENLNACTQIFDESSRDVFRGAEFDSKNLQLLYTCLQNLDDTLGKLFAGGNVIERRVEVPVEKIVEKRVEVPVEEIVNELDKVQRALQDELPRLQGTLKTIAGVREELDFHAQKFLAPRGTVAGNIRHGNVWEDYRS